MNKYEATIDGGDGGEETFEAATVNEALVQAIDWAEDGDWPEDGCTVSVRVYREDDDGDVIEEEREDIEIVSAEQKRDAELIEDGDVIAKDEGEYSTEQLVVVAGECYYMHPNGGARGAYDRQCGDGVWREKPCAPTRQVTQSEARRLMLDWGYEPADVAKLTQPID